LFSPGTSVAHFAFLSLKSRYILLIPCPTFSLFNTTCRGWGHTYANCCPPVQSWFSLLPGHLARFSRCPSWPFSQNKHMICFFFSSPIRLFHSWSFPFAPTLPEGSSPCLNPSPWNVPSNFFSFLPTEYTSHLFLWFFPTQSRFSICPRGYSRSGNWLHHLELPLTHTCPAVVTICFVMVLSLHRIGFLGPVFFRWDFCSGNLVAKGNWLRRFRFGHAHSSDHFGGQSW